MTDDVIVDKAKFDAMLKRLIRAKPTTLEQVKAKPNVQGYAKPRLTQRTRNSTK